MKMQPGNSFLVDLFCKHVVVNLTVTILVVLLLVLLLYYYCYYYYCYLYLLLLLLLLLLLFSVSIPVSSGGTIAGKAWGNPKGQPVLGLHGNKHFGLLYPSPFSLSLSLSLSCRLVK